MSADQLDAFTRFFDSARLIEAALSRHLLAEHNMALGDYEVLVHLDGADGALRLTELADRCVSPRSTISQTLVRLEDRGWIRREKAVGDARGALAHLLPAGDEALAAAAPKHAEIIKRHLLDCWSAAELAVIGRAMDASAERLRELRP